MDGENSVCTLDEAVVSAGFGKFQLLVLSYAGLGWFAEAMEIMILSFVGPVVKSQWDLSSSQESLLSTVVFAGMLVGAYSRGIVSDYYGRRNGFLGVNLLTSVAGLLSAFSPNYVFLVQGCFSSQSSGPLEQFLRLHLHGWSWRWLLALSSLPAFALLVFHPLVPESLRYLCAKGRMNDAHSILEKMAQVNQSKLPHGVLVSDSTTGLDEESATPEYVPLLSSTRKIDSDFRSCLSSFTSLFSLLSSKLIRITVLLWVLYFSNVFSYYCIILLTSELNSGQSKCGSTILQSETLQDDSLYINVFITSLAELPGVILSAIIVDKIGRKLSIAIMSVSACIFLLPLLHHQSATLTTVLLFGARMSTDGSFSLAAVYAQELYPTVVRATGSGAASAAGRIGGMICPLVAVGLVTGCHLTKAIVLFEVVIGISAVSVMLFPFETKGQELSDTVGHVSDSE